MEATCCSTLTLDASIYDFQPIPLPPGDPLKALLSHFYAGTSTLVQFFYIDCILTLLQVLCCIPHFKKLKPFIPLFHWQYSSPEISPPGCSALEVLCCFLVTDRPVLRLGYTASAKHFALCSYPSGSSIFLSLSYSSLPRFVHPLFIPRSFATYFWPHLSTKTCYPVFTRASSQSIFWMLSGIWNSRPSLSFLPITHLFQELEVLLQIIYFRGFQIWLQVKITRRAY